MIDTVFLDELASSAPTPGGGGASAYCAALAAALSSMVGNLTVGKERYASVEGEMIAEIDRLEAVRARLVRLIDEDAAAFGPLAAAYRMPKSTPEEQRAKEAALQEALVGAIEVPLEIMRQCVRVVEASGFMARNGSRMAVSDAAASAILAKAAAHAASLNVRINIASMDDACRAAEYERELEEILELADEADAVYALSCAVMREG